MPCVLSELFLKQVSHRPHETALKTSGEPISFCQLHSRAVAIADALTGAEGLGSQRPATPTFTVAILCGKSDIAEICAVVAVILAGGCFVPIDDKLPLPRLSEVFRDAQPDAIVTTRSFLAGERAAGGSGIPAVIEQQGCQILHLEDGGKPSESRETIDTFRETKAHDENGESEESIGKHSCGKRVPRSSACTASAAARHANVVPDDEGPVADKGNSSLAGQACPGPLEHDTRPGAASESKGLADSGLYDRKELHPCPVPRDEEDLLYILYTSGTTGPQKGVRGTRSGAVNRILFGWSLCPFRGDAELVCRRTPSCFVDFVAEVFCPLLAGVPLFLPTPGAHADPLLLAPALAEVKATRITLTPSLLASMLRTTSSDTETLLPDVHTWFISGEALHPDLALLFRRRAARGARLINLYGSTEVSGDATFCTLDDIIDTERGCAGFRPSGDMGVLIGKPLPGVHVSVVGTDLTPVPIGQAGELLVGGVGVALGYHRAPQEAATKFLHTVALSTTREREDVVHMPGLKPGSRVVRTGDRVVQPVADGPLFWLGKMDGEVKVRGVRVSPEAVEVVACRASGLPVGAFAVVYDHGMDTDGSAGGDSSAVTKAAIATRSPDRGRLWGFFEPNGIQVNNEGLAKLRLQLAAVLTTAQLPAVLVPVVGRFPLTTSGKVDKRALLREHWKQVEALDGRPVASAEGVDAYLPFPTDVTTQKVGTLAAAREAVARAIVSVLPDARASIASWLINLQESAPGSSNCSKMTFGELGGTSLLAVEAAWRALRSTRWTVAGSTNTPVPPSSMLTANDFLRGTLDDAVSTLHGILEKERHAEETKTSSGTAIGLAATGLAATGAGQRKPPVPPACPGLLSPAIADASAVGFQSTSSPGRKRQRLDFEKRDQTTHSRSFLALGRAASGLRKTIACLGEVGDRVGDGSGLKGAKADLEVRWSSCLTKCIDATPLVFLPKSEREIVGRSRTGGVDNAGGMMAEAPSQFASPESVGPSTYCPSVVGTQRLGGRVREAGKSTTCGDARISTSHVSSGTVYIGSHSGEFQALDLETGDREWLFTAGGRIESGAACSCDGSTIFVGCHDWRLYAIDRRMGVLSWSFETGDAIKCTPICMPEAPSSDLTDRGAREEGELVDRGTVVFGSHDGVLRSLWEADGVLRWNFDCGGALFASPAHDAEARVVYAATTKGRVVALDNSALVVFAGTEAAGSVDHNRKLTGSSTTQPTLLWDTYLPAPVFSSPAVCSASGTVVLGCVDGGLYCVSSVGEQVWVCRRGDKPVFSSPCILPPPCKEMGGDVNNASGTRVIWGCHDGVVRCRTGVDLAWETDVGRGQPVFSSPCFAAVGCEGCALLCPLVFACSVPGLISALCLADGEVLGEIQLPGELFSSAVVAGPSIVVGCRDNRVYVLDILVTCPKCIQTKAVATVC
ncbi:unnamed protein product [Ectocarpus sp. 6 AP-2014]